MITTIEQARAAKGRLAGALAGNAAVNGIGLTAGDGGYAVRVNLCRPLLADEQIPDEMDGVRVEKRVIGTIRNIAE